MLRTVKRIVYLAIASAMYVCTLGGRIGRGQSIVLCYHGVTTQQKIAFERQLEYVSERITSIDRIKKNSATRIGVKPHIVLTFDDAYSNLCVNVVPLLNRLKLPAVIFAVTNNMGEKPAWGLWKNDAKTMTERQLTECRSETIGIGSHSHRHVDLAKLTGEDLESELGESKECLEQLLGAPVHDLALPYGSYGEHVLKCALDVGYRRIYTLEAHAFKGSQDWEKIGRFTMSPDAWLVEFLLVCAGAYCWLGPFRRIVNRLRHKET